MIGTEKTIISIILILLSFNRNYLNLNELRKLKLTSLMRKKLYKVVGQGETSFGLIIKSYIPARLK